MQAATALASGCRLVAGRRIDKLRRPSASCAAEGCFGFVREKRWRETMPIQLQRILLPTDFSPNTSTAAKYACELATRFDAELHLLHTLEIHPSLTPAFGMGLVLPKFISESKAA